MYWNLCQENLRFDTAGRLMRMESNRSHFKTPFLLVCGFLTKDRKIISKAALKWLLIIWSDG
jgi:hypothetical protein